MLDDCTQPERLHLRGYKLSDEMLSAGTLPQVGGARVCSIHAKANCLEPVIASVTAGRPYRHVLGFEAGETSRAAKDSLFNTERRTGWYPLLDWGWDRAVASTSSPRRHTADGRSRRVATASSR